MWETLGHTNLTTWGSSEIKEFTGNFDDVYSLLPTFSQRVASTHVKLHRKCAPLFMRENQEFIWGLDLKPDLARLDKRYSEFPEAVRNRGIMSFASTTPHDGNYLTAKLWDRHFGKEWRTREETVSKPPKQNKDFIDEMNRFSESEPLSPEDVDFDPENSDVVSVQRRVRRQKGKWFQVPKDLPNKGK